MPWSLCGALEGVTGSHGRSRQNVLTPAVCTTGFVETAGDDDTTCVVTVEPECCAQPCTETNITETAWSDCAVMGGVAGSFGQTRRSVVTLAVCATGFVETVGDDNTACVADYEEQCCPKDCVMGAWGACSYNATADAILRSRDEATAATCGGDNSCALEVEVCCEDPGCTGPAVTAWGACGTLAGVNGSYGRSRTTTACGACSATPENECCPINCVETAWSAWSACSWNASSLQSEKTRTTSVTGSASCGGLDT